MSDILKSKNNHISKIINKTCSDNLFLYKNITKNNNLESSDFQRNDTKLSNAKGYPANGLNNGFILEDLNNYNISSQGSSESIGSNENNKISKMRDNERIFKLNQRIDDIKRLHKRENNSQGSNASASNS